jgi:hypothetical protein
MEDEWKELEPFLKHGYMLTIFGYGAPATDVEAVNVMLRGWGENPSFELAEVEILDTKPQEESMETWERFLCRTHCGTPPTFATVHHVYGTRSKTR